VAVGVYRITEMFEAELARYTGAPHVVAVDSCTSALMLCLHRERVAGTTIDLPSCTYMSVPCAVIQAGARIRWRKPPHRVLSGVYPLGGTRIFDSALRFTAGMYWPG